MQVDLLIATSNSVNDGYGCVQWRYLEMGVPRYAQCPAVQEKHLLNGFTLW